MQVKVFSVPLWESEQAVEEMNVFLRSHRVIDIQSQFVNGNTGCYWTFCVTYIKGPSPNKKKQRRKDYKDELDPNAFERFKAMRKKRKQLAEADGVPAYVVFTDKELSILAKMEKVSISSMKSIPGVGDRKVERYGRKMIEYIDGLRTKKAKSDD